MRPFGLQPPPLHPRRMNFYLKSFQFRMDGAREAIDFAPRVDFPTGAARTAEWYREKAII